jgi:methionyl-tRNA formyltransferase
MQEFFVQLLGTRSAELQKEVESLGCRTQIINGPEEQTPAADICLASGLHYIVSPDLLRITRLGLWGFHESKLPEGRGCAPLQWTVLEGKTELTVSFFELVEQFDSGRILGQMSLAIERTDLLDDLRNKADTLRFELIKRCLRNYLSGSQEPFSQSGAKSYYRKRTPEDSRLDLNATLLDQWPLIRVCDNEAFPAWFEVNGTKYLLKCYKAGE